MVKFTVDGNWVKFERSTIFVPKQLLVDMRKTLQGEMKAVRQQLLANVSGAVLNRHSGRLAKTISARSRVYNNSKVWARAGSKYFIGRFWEYGFKRNGKEFAPRSWATPVVSANTNRIAEVMERTIAKTLSDGGL